ncbi:MAG: glycosyltransferase family 2 protein, partial [Mariprofundaceae bacterium]|nr:glycosyltransferase family 2 protein [Mariprofundaceae bacterium]
MNHKGINHNETQKSNTYILLATYNATSFLKQQIQSIYKQSINKKVTIIIRDDASTDATPQMLSNLTQEYSHIHIISDDQRQLGAAKNFSKLLNTAFTYKANHCFLADQDDVWLPEKVQSQQKQMHKLEQNHANKPLLIHSDMMVVDSSLKEISPSFMKYQKIAHNAKRPINVLLVQNFVTGCTMMLNRKLLEVALPIPKEALMHDWWLALCAATFGKIDYIDKPLVKYRQHGNNEVGAQHIKNLINPFKNNWYRHWNKGRKNLHQSISQAQALVQRIKQHD